MRAAKCFKKRSEMSEFVGILSDWFGGARGASAASLRLALLLLAPTGFWAAWHFFLAARTVAPDMRRAVEYNARA